MYGTLGNKKTITKIPSDKMIEQAFDSVKHRFERAGNYIKINYLKQIGWVSVEEVVPFISTLSNDIFLQKILMNHERFISSMFILPENKIRSNAIEELYIRDAKRRFDSDKEFEKWYSDNLP